MQFIRPRRVLELIGVSRTTLWRMVQAGTFPRPVRITERNRGYVLEAVEAWMKARADEPMELYSVRLAVSKKRIECPVSCAPCGNTRTLEIPEIQPIADATTAAELDSSGD